VVSVAARRAADHAAQRRKQQRRQGQAPRSTEPKACLRETNIDEGKEMACRKRTIPKLREL
jgi:hypothetical protein